MPRHSKVLADMMRSSLEGDHEMLFSMANSPLPDANTEADRVVGDRLLTVEMEEIDMKLFRGPRT